MHNTFTLDPLHVDDVVVYLKNERTGSSTIRKCKFIGQVVGFDKTRVKIRQLSKADQFVTPEKCVDYGEVMVYPHEIVHVIISKHMEDSHTRLLKELSDLIDKQKKYIRLLIGRWFSALEDEGVNPWSDEECMKTANKYWYTEEDYRKYLRSEK